MIVVSNALSPDVVAHLRAALGAAAWEDGSGTSTARAKHNAQCTDEALSALVDRALASCAEFKRVAIPYVTTRPMFARYREGDAYGPHLDEAFIDGARTDLAVTIALSGPTEYEGGGLVVAGADPVATGSGAAIIYPANTVHEVLPVTSGERLVVVLWVQSRIRDADKRQLVADLNAASIRTSDVPTRLAYQNLLRMWGE